MKNIQNLQSDLVNDTCNDCGSFVDVGAVIDEHDVVLALTFSDPSAASAIAEKAKQRFAGTTSQFVANGEGGELTLTFSFSAEKMIFQLENGL